MIRKNLLDYVFKLENFSNAIEDILERTNGLIRLENTVIKMNLQKVLSIEIYIQRKRK